MSIRGKDLIVPGVVGGVATSLYFFGGGREFIRTFDWRKVVPVHVPPNDRDGGDSGSGGGSWGSGSESSGGPDVAEFVAVFAALALLTYALTSRRKGA